MSLCNPCVSRRGTWRSYLTAMLIAIVLLAAGPRAGAAVYEIWPPTTLGSMIPILQPGDTLILHAGDYARAWTGGMTGGTPGNWITIKGADGEARPRIYYNGTDRNIFDLTGTSYMRFQNLEIQGGSDAFKIRGTCHYIVIENVYMHHLGSGGVNLSGITEMSNLTVRDCEIAYTSYGTSTPGEGFYLGVHGAYTGKQVFWDDIMGDPKRKPDWYNQTLRPSAEDFERGTVEIPKENVVPVPGGL